MDGDETPINQPRGKTERTKTTNINGESTMTKPNKKRGITQTKSMNNPLFLIMHQTNSQMQDTWLVDGFT